jgi:hypothetical protein
MNIGKSVITNSREYDGCYDETRLPDLHYWKWPKGTWFQSRLDYARDLNRARSAKGTKNPSSLNLVWAESESPDKINYRPENGTALPRPRNSKSIVRAKTTTARQPRRKRRAKSGPQKHLVDTPPSAS